MAILPKSGRVTIAESIAAQPIHLAWGAGDGSWVTPPSEDNNAVALITELARRTATEVGYVTPSPTGDILLPSGRFARSVTPTNSLYIRTQFDFADAQNSVIREIGVFVGTEVQSGLPVGQNYFTPGQIVDPGRLLHIENLAPIIRDLTIRESFEVVVSF